MSAERSRWKAIQRAIMLKRLQHSQQHPDYTPNSGNRKATSFRLPAPHPNPALPLLRRKEWSLHIIAEPLGVADTDQQAGTGTAEARSA
jgi:hypothetical protein